MSGTVHILGAGMAGLSAAVTLAGAGRRVAVYEAAAQAGGRCRSYRDTVLGRTIDNGNHLVLSGNHAVFAYLDAIGATDAVEVLAPAEIPFLDLVSGQRWTVAPDRGRIPWSWLSAARRVPGAGLMDYLRGWRLTRATDAQAVADVMPVSGPLWDRFWAPVIVAVMNTPPAAAAAGSMGRVVRETLARGEAACRPVLFPSGLGEALVQPALRFIETNGGALQFNRRVRGIEQDADRVTALVLADGTVPVGPDDTVIAALPAGVAPEVLPGVTAPDRFTAIVNGHFVVDAAVAAPPFLGLIGGTAEWLFRRGDVVSVTVSAAGSLAETDSGAIAQALWRDVARAYGLGDRALPAHRILKEKRATFEQTPDQMRRRRGPQSPWRNLYLAGDWTDTGLPATIEGSLRSGRRAAGLVLESFQS